MHLGRMFADSWDRTSASLVVLQLVDRFAIFLIIAAAIFNARFPMPRRKIGLISLLYIPAWYIGVLLATPLGHRYFH